MAAIDIPTKASTVPRPCAAMMRPAAETKQAKDSVQRRSLNRSETQPQFDDLRQEQQHTDACGDNAEIIERQPEDFRVPERLPEADFAFGLNQPPFGFKRRNEPARHL
jgi:hypothetical protein